EGASRWPLFESVASLICRGSVPSILYLIGGWQHGRERLAKAVRDGPLAVIRGLGIVGNPRTKLLNLRAFFTNERKVWMVAEPSDRFGVSRVRWCSDLEAPRGIKHMAGSSRSEGHPQRSVVPLRQKAWRRGVMRVRRQARLRRTFPAFHWRPAGSPVKDLGSVGLRAVTAPLRA